MVAMSIRDEVRDAPAYVFRTWPHRVKLDQNEAPEDLAEALRERVLARLREVDWHRYPELRAHTVAKAIAARDGWDPAGVVVAPGSNVLIQALVIAAGLGRRLLTVAPTFAVYASQARLLGVEATEVPLLPDGFGLDVEAMTRELRRGPGVLFLADPAAPTGNRLDDDAVAAVLDAASRHDWTVVIDEAYWPYAGRHRLDEIRGDPGRLALRTFSKADALGGVRLGYALSHPDTAQQVGKVLLPFDVSALQAAVAEVVLGDPEAATARERRIETARRERERVHTALAAHPEVTVYPSVTNFLLFRVPDAEAVHQAFLNEGILVRRQDHLPGLAGCLRVTVGSTADDDAFLAAAQRALPPRPEAAPREVVPREVGRG